jgi:beta-phosphoglucomutase family hydrolase
VIVRSSTVEPSAISTPKTYWRGQFGAVAFFDIEIDLHDESAWPERRRVTSRNMTDASNFRWADYDGVLFDLDGVITPTAEIHEHAWGELFAAHDYTGADYLDYIDGKPRYDGVRSFLESRDIDLPDGDLDDPPGDHTVCALGNRKNALFNEILERDGIAPYPGSQATLELLSATGIPSAIVSSSKNAVPVLEAAGLGNRFDVIVDGVVAADLGLNGKPAPDGYLLGAQRLGVDPARTVVVEDATSGVAAGKAGAFAVTIGVDRGAGHEKLIEHGATFVVDDLSDLLPTIPDEG